MFIVLYFIVSISIAVYYTKQASKSAESFFLGGQNMPWWLAGTSMVASTFAADTPLAVAELVAMDGIAGNWVWWNMAFGSMLTVFFFARMWRRSGVMTDVEFVEFRYGGKPGKILRAFKAVFYGLVANCLIIGWVCLAMVTILQVVFPVMVDQPARAYALTFAIMAVAAVSTALSGLQGSIVTDFFQFGLAMSCCLVLAGLAISDQGTMTDLIDHFDGTDVLNFGPSINSDAPRQVCAAASDAAASLVEDLVNNTGSVAGATGKVMEGMGDGAVGKAIVMTPVAFFARVGIQWWAAWYPGAEPGGGGYIAQRMMAAKNEKHAFLAVLWFTMAHYSLRSWPWIIVGIAAAKAYPGLERPGEGFVMIMTDVLPTGLLGLLVAAFIAAFMSTITTQLVWGTSYLINDFYRRFVKTDGDNAHYVMMSRVATLILCGVALVVAALLKSITGAWNILISSSAGIGVVLILRWYWWRINGWSEVTAMFCPIFLALVRGIASAAGACQHDYPALLRDPDSMYITTLITVSASLVTCYFTPPDDEEVLDNFFVKVRPAGPGWAPYRAKHPEIVINTQLKDLFMGWIAAVAMVYCALFFLGSLVLLRPVQAIFTLIIGGIASGFLIWHLPRMLAKDAEDESEAEEGTLKKMEKDLDTDTELTETKAAAADGDASD